MKTPGSDGVLSIGALAERTGLNVSAIRYYEEVGLIPAAERRPSGHRFYDARSIDMLVLIRHCRDFGFSVDVTRALVSLAADDGKNCAEARSIASQHLDTVRAKVQELKRLEQSLAQFVQCCDEQCIGGPAPDCTILRDLAAAESCCKTVSSCCG